MKTDSRLETLDCGCEYVNVAGARGEALRTCGDHRVPRVGKAISRFQIQWVFPKGGYVRFDSRRDVPFTPKTIGSATNRSSSLPRSTS